MSAADVIICFCVLLQVVDNYVHWLPHGLIEKKTLPLLPNCDKLCRGTSRELTNEIWKKNCKVEMTIEGKNPRQRTDDKYDV